MATCETCRCPKCGSTEVDMPRTYGPAMRLQHCQRLCLSCGHEGRQWPSVAEAHRDPEWTEASDGDLRDLSVVGRTYSGPRSISRPVHEVPAHQPGA